eukprot:GILI01042281.1.p1 GENE.GILI01042281.1~~GILI01042281.1.p1  ORF type:complete len:154 (+),score=8.27 GILI01042281.1:36-497(+)
MFLHRCLSYRGTFRRLVQPQQHQHQRIRLGIDDFLLATSKPGILYLHIDVIDISFFGLSLQQGTTLGLFLFEDDACVDSSFIALPPFPERSPPNKLVFSAEHLSDSCSLCSSSAPASFADCVCLNLGSITSPKSSQFLRIQCSSSGCFVWHHD